MATSFEAFFWELPAGARWGNDVTGPPPGTYLFFIKFDDLEMFLSTKSLGTDGEKGLGQGAAEKRGDSVVKHFLLGT